MKTDNRHSQAVHFSMIIACLMIMNYSIAGAQTQQMRNRGESFHQMSNSNTAGSGDLWVKLSGVAHVWDNDSIDATQAPDRKWTSNVRGFPEIQLQFGIRDFSMLTVESRPLSWAMKPGFVSTALKLTWPNNKNLRIHGVAAEFKYRYNFSDGPPTLGGYIGFLPEGFVIKGSSVEARLIYEFDMVAWLSQVPLRLIVNAGARIPMNDSMYSEYYQYIADAGLVYSGYGYDFFASFSIDAFNNLSEPIVFKQDQKRYVVFFSENLMYVTLGGNVRYDNGMCLSIATPLLLSTNQESRMGHGDGEELTNDDNPELFPIEKEMGIKDPFDPWFVKWKIAMSISFPISAKITSAEMMRNFLMMKNRKEQKRIDIDDRLKVLEESSDQVDEEVEKTQRLEQIRKRREQAKQPE